MKSFSVCLVFLTVFAHSVFADVLAYWNFEIVTGETTIASAVDTVSHLELKQENSGYQPTWDSLTPPCPPGTANNTKSAGFSRQVKRHLILDANSAEKLNFGESTPFTIELWIHPLSYPTIDAPKVSSVILLKRGGAPTDTIHPGYQLSMNAQGKLFFRAEGLVGGKTLASTASIPLSKWSHLAVTRDFKGSFKFYINGQLDATSSGPLYQGSLSNNGDFILGSTPFAQGKDFFFDGYIDDIRISTLPLEPIDLLYR